MKTVTKLSTQSLLLTAWVALAGLSAGCATNGRYVLLKEYGPTGPAASSQSLKGLTVCIKGFQAAPSLTSPDPKTSPEQPADFRFCDFTSEQNKLWKDEFKDLRKRTTKSDWREIGNVRNGFGMVMSHVYALNDPGAWLRETLKMDLEAQGATVVDASTADTADVCLGGTIQFCRVDIYMKIWGDMVLDLETQPKGQASSRMTLHTAGGTLAAVGSTGEFYKPLRECRQKLSYLVTREILKVVKK